MGEAIEQLAHFIADTSWTAIPEAVRHHAKLVFLDTVGVMLAGSVQPEVAGARARLTATGGHGATILAPGAPTSDPRRTAAFLNGLAGRSIEWCSTPAPSLAWRNSLSDSMSCRASPISSAR
jgi:2-methylcitrate dehydratase PrpD